MRKMLIATVAFAAFVFGLAGAYAAKQSDDFSALKPGSYRVYTIQQMFAHDGTPVFWLTADKMNCSYMSDIKTTACIEPRAAQLYVIPRGFLESVPPMEKIAEVNLRIDIDRYGFAKVVD
jgi:hypothetical protein